MNAILTHRASAVAWGMFAMLLIMTLLSSCSTSDPGSADGHMNLEPDDHAEEAHHENDLVRLTADELTEFGIEVQIAGPASLQTEKVFPGEVRANADRYAHVTPRVPGVVRSVQANLGQQVQAGQTMAVLESRELADLKSAYLAATERLSLAEANFDRERRLFEKKISSEQEYLEARQALSEARIAVRSATQKLRALGFAEAYVTNLANESESLLTLYPLRAPISGSVVEKHIVQGEALEADREAFEVADLSSVWVDLSIYQQDMALVEEGQTVVIAAGGRTTRGTISYVRPIIGEETRTALARVVLPNPDRRWKPGLFVNGTVAIGAIEYPVVVPASAVQTLDEERVVFVRTEEGFVPRRVTLGARNSQQIAIEAGLAAGEAYAATGGFTLKSQLQKSELSDGHAH